MNRQSCILGISSFVIAALFATTSWSRSEENPESVLTLVSSTTLGGYVSTVAIWRPTYTTSYVPMFRWNPDSGGNGHYYGVIEQPFDWAQAENASQALGGHLASVNSAAEQAFLVSLFLSDESPYRDRPLWIGLNDAAGTGTFTWSSTEAATFANWAGGFPVSGTTPAYAAMNWSHSLVASNPKGDWSDVALSGTTGLGGNTTGPYYGVIELTAIVPEPGSVTLLFLGLLAMCCRHRASRSHQTFG